MGFGDLSYSGKRICIRLQRPQWRKARSFLKTLLLSGLTEPNLKAFANAVLHCSNCAEVSVVLNEADARAVKRGLIPDTSPGGPVQPINYEDDAKRIEAIVGTAVPAYGEIMEKWPLVIFPVSRLPLSKEEMKTALRLAWRIRKEPNLREFVELAYAHICQFRDDITAPIDPTLTKDATPQEAISILDPFLAIADKVEAERAELEAEFREYKAFMQAQGR